MLIPVLLHEPLRVYVKPIKYVWANTDWYKCLDCALSTSRSKHREVMLECTSVSRWQRKEFLSRLQLSEAKKSPQSGLTRALSHHRNPPKLDFSDFFLLLLPSNCGETRSFTLIREERFVYGLRGEKGDVEMEKVLQYSFFLQPFVWLSRRPKSWETLWGSLRSFLNILYKVSSLFQTHFLWPLSRIEWRTPFGIRKPWNHGGRSQNKQSSI